MGLGRSLALPVLRTVSMRGSCRAVTLPVISGSAFPSVPSVLSAASQSFWAVPAGGRRKGVSGLSVGHEKGRCGVVWPEKHAILRD